MWYDVNGSMIDSVFHGCCEAILSIIHSRPGIYEANICKKLAIAMSPMEVRDVLDELVRRGCVRRRFIIKPVVTLFSAPQDFIECGTWVAFLLARLAQIMFVLTRRLLR
jgi:hypothetical protein